MNKPHSPQPVFTTLQADTGRNNTVKSYTMYRMLIMVFATLSLLLVSQVAQAQQSQFQSLPTYPTQARAGAHAILNITNSTGTHNWQFDVTNQVSGLRGGQCNSINLNQKVMAWLLLRVIGSGDFHFNVEAYNSFGNMVGVGSERVSLGYGPLRGLNIECVVPLGPPPIPAPQPLPIPYPNPQPPVPQPPVIDADALSQLDLNYRMWRLQNISDYSVVSRRFCFCIRESTLPGRVQVQNGYPVSKTFTENGRTIPSQYSDSFLTIQDAFTVIRDAIMEGADSIDVAYDPFYGFPTSISIDYIAQAMDDEVSIELSEFRPSHGGYLPPVIPRPIPAPLPPVTLPPVTITPADICQTPPYGSQSSETLEILKDNGAVWACIRGNKPTPCSTIDVISQRSGNQFSIFSRVTESTALGGVVCSQVIAPFAKLVQLDTQGLGHGGYYVNYYPLHSQGNLITTKLSLP